MAALEKVIRLLFIVHRRKQSQLTTNYKLQTTNRRGFSLVEILVVVSILALIGIVAIPNLRRFSKEQEIDNVALQVLNTLKTAQSQASSRIKCPNGESADNWTVRLTVNGYSLIAGCQTSGPQDIFTKPYKPSTATTDTFGGGLSVCGVSSGGDSVDVVFSQNQVNYVCTSSPTLETGLVLLTLSNSSGDFVRLIRIEPGGVIKIE